MIARVITYGVAVARGAGGRRGSARRRRYHAGAPCGVVAIENAYVDIGVHTLGYRERRRQAKLRRRARNRTIAIGRKCRRHYVDPWWRAVELDRARFGHEPVPWWSTPEGRAKWTEDDRAMKRARRTGG